jgi:hypothetical protein
MGEHGYAVLDSVTDSLPPGGHGRYDTLNDLRTAFHQYGDIKIKIIPRYPWSWPKPDGWVYRPLTGRERNYLQ